MSTPWKLAVTADHAEADGSTIYGDIGLGDLPYSGPTAALTDVWRALRASMRSVLERTSLADVAAGALPDHVRGLADDYRAQEEQRGRAVT